MQSSIRVICRFRPVNSREKEEDKKRTWNTKIEFPDDEHVDVCDEMRGTHHFAFDKVFSPNTEQEIIYNDAIKSTICDVLAGFNGTLFAYGQTGSGKSFTMFGSDIFDSKLKGIIPRASQHIFQHIMHECDEVEYTIKCSFLEIYQEKICDLFDPSKQDLPIRESPKKGIYVENITEEYCADDKDIFALLKLGESNRHASFTQMNATSSRSHSVFTIFISKKDKCGSTTCGKLNLVDLAGSEKIAKTGATGDTLQEAKKINSSLSTLGQVIHALSEGNPYIPYRDSKLTRILQESLGGNTKTTLIINCSPHGFNYDETISTLQFAQRAKTIKNMVKMNHQRSAEELRAILDQLLIQVQKMKQHKELLEAEINEIESRGIGMTTKENIIEHNLILPEKLETLIHVHNGIYNIDFDNIDSISMLHDIRNDIEMRSHNKMKELYAMRDKLNSGNFVTDNSEMCEHNEETDISEMCEYNEKLSYEINQVQFDIQKYKEEICMLKEKKLQNVESIAKNHEKRMDVQQTSNELMNKLTKMQNDLAAQTEQQKYLELENNDLTDYIEDIEKEISKEKNKQKFGCVHCCLPLSYLRQTGKNMAQMKLLINEEQNIFEEFIRNNDIERKLLSDTEFKKRKNDINSLRKEIATETNVNRQLDEEYLMVNEEIANITASYNIAKANMEKIQKVDDERIRLDKSIAYMTKCCEMNHIISKHDGPAGQWLLKKTQNGVKLY